MIVEVSCGDEMCIARATGKLTKVKYGKLEPDGGPPYGLVAPGEELRLGPEMAKDAQRKQVRKALDEGKNVQAKVTVRADGCGRQRGDREAHDQDSSSRNDPGAEAVGLNGRAASAALLVTGCGK